MCCWLGVGGGGARFKCECRSGRQQRQTEKAAAATLPYPPSSAHSSHGPPFASHIDSFLGPFPPLLRLLFCISFSRPRCLSPSLAPAWTSCVIHQSSPLASPYLALPQNQPTDSLNPTPWPVPEHQRYYIAFHSSSRIQPWQTQTIRKTERRPTTTLKVSTPLSARVAGFLLSVGPDCPHRRAYQPSVAREVFGVTSKPPIWRPPGLSLWILDWCGSSTVTVGTCV